MRKYFFYIAITFVILQFTFGVFGFSTNQNMVSNVHIAYAGAANSLRDKAISDALANAKANSKKELTVAESTKISEEAGAKYDKEHPAREVMEDGFWETMTKLASALMKPSEIVLGVIGFLLFIILSLSSLVLICISFIMTAIMEFSINTIAFQDAQPIGQAILFGWTFIRDLLNITLIFILVWSGLKTILGWNKDLDSGLIGKVIMAGVLVNFSLFFTQVVIDFFNIFSRAILNSINTVTSGRDFGSYIFLTFFQNYLETLRSPLMNWEKLIGLPAILNQAIPLTLIWVAIYVFAKVAKIFLVRAIVFVFCMITSPIMFIGLIIPQLSKYRSTWISNLINSSLTAPIFLTCLYLVVKIIGIMSTNGILGEGIASLGNLGVSKDKIDAFAGTTTMDGFITVNYTALVYFALIFALLYAAVKVTEEYSSSLGNAIWEQGMNLVKKAMDVTVKGVMAIATGGTSAALIAGTAARGLAQRNAAVVLNDKSLHAQADISHGNTAAALDAREKLAKAKNDYENPMGPLKNIFTATNKITGLMGVKTYNPLDKYVKESKWDPSKAINNPSIPRTLLGMTAYKSKEEKQKDLQSTSKEIGKIVTENHTKEGEKYVRDNVTNDKNAATQSTKNLKIIEEGILNDKKVVLDNDNKKLREAMKKEYEEIVKTRKEIEELEKSTDHEKTESELRNLEKLQESLKEAKNRNSSRRNEISANMAKAGFNVEKIKIGDDGDYKIQLSDLAEKTLEDLKDQKGQALFGKTYKEIQKEGDELYKTWMAKVDKGWEEALKREQSGLITQANTIRNKLSDNKSEQDKALENLKKAIKEEENKTKEEKPEGKTEEKKEEGKK